MGSNERFHEEQNVSETDSGESSEEASGSDEDVASWISWFCSLKGNEFFCEVEEDFIQDDFNLSGLSSLVPYYDYALDLILDSESPSNEILTEEQHELVEGAAEMLYGLIHVRFILTARGMAAMFQKYKAAEFGRCPRVGCGGQSCLPVGTSDVPRQATVKLFCPKCEDIYFPRSKYQGNADGAYFGTTFPHLLLMTYPSLRPPRPTETYVPRVFGFKLHPTALGRDPAAAAAAAAGPSNSGAAGQSNALAIAGSSQQRDHGAAAAAGPAATAANDRRGKRREDERQQGAESFSRTAGMEDGLGRQDLEMRVS